MQVMGLFSGIGGFELGFRRAGFTIAGVCEIEPYACRVLEKHFPEARLYKDVKELTGERLRADGIRPFVVTGGFPCQDISLAGKGAGLGGERSGLWFEMHRVIAETRPRWVVAENVAALRSRGLDQVLGSLAAIGYDAEWHCIPASAVGAPHRRDRIWIVAYPSELHGHGCGVHAGSGSEGLGRVAELGNGSPTSNLLAYPARVQPGRAEQRALGERVGPGGQPQPVAYADEHAGQQWRPGDTSESKGRRDVDRGVVGADAVAQPEHGGREGRLTEGLRPGATLPSSWWQSEPDVGRVVARLSPRLHGDLNAATKETGTGKVLCALRDSLHAEDLQWPVGGFGRLQTPEILLTELCSYAGKAKSLGHVSLAGAEASPLVMRGVWFDGASACPSCRRRAEEQRSRKHPDLVRLLPQLLTCDCRATWLDPTGTPTVASRVDRLRALGNSVVPQIPEIIAHAIREYEFL